MTPIKIGILAGLLIPIFMVLVRSLTARPELALSLVTYADHGATAVLQLTNRTGFPIQCSDLQVMVATPGGWEYFPRYRVQIPGWSGYSVSPRGSRRLEALFPWP